MSTEVKPATEPVAVTSPKNMEIDTPPGFNAEVEVCLDAIRAQFVDPTAQKSPGEQVGIAMSALTTLLGRVNPAAAELAEAGILLQAVALSSVIYHANIYTPGDWMREVTIDFERTYRTIVLLLRLDQAPAEPPLGMNRGGDTFPA